ncbi:hypothetical protein [Candidatus Thiodiazotropha sp. CDECU1]|uniref:hypothetical protein n=1 Tax=Candidatus Thiodiazotropha sp. CDECU1 TaxID=3065865 RepID=UPI00292F5E43|nr:hypothetical protein [Candidatus Thiodiazotropha sp. CDECU1]
MTLIVNSSPWLTGWEKLVTHTREHFTQGEQWMKVSGFPAIHEHTDQHRRVLEELDRFSTRKSTLPL